MLKVVMGSLLCGMLALLAGIYLLYATSPSATSSQVLSWEADTARVEVGNATRTAQGLRVQVDRTGQAVIALPLSQLRASDYPFMHLRFGKAPPSDSLVILWNRQGSGEKPNIYRLPGAAGRSFWLPLHNLKDWSGKVDKLAIVFLGAAGEKLVLERAQLMPSSLPRQLQVFYSEIASFVPWRHSSINHYTGTRSAGAVLYPVPLVAVVIMLSLVACSVLAVCRRPRLRIDWRIPATIFMIGWISLDLLWQFKLGRQLALTHAQFSGKNTGEKLAAGPDQTLVQMMRDVAERTASPDTRIFVGSTSDYAGMRGAYYLYPANVYWHRRGPELPSPEYLHRGDYIVLLAPTEIHFDRRNNTLFTPDRNFIGVELIMSRAAGKLFRVM